ncbi:MAG: hypothetical protein ABIR51_10035 [Sphingomicrobium sp.]
MNKIYFAAVGAAALALSACGGKKDALADNVQENYENAADNLDAMAGNTANSAEADALSNQADALKVEGKNKAEAVENGAVSANQVNAM